MRTFNYEKKWEILLTPETVGLLSQIHEYKGKQDLFIGAKADVLSQLLETANIQSADSSNRIEGTKLQTTEHYLHVQPKKQGRCHRPTQCIICFIKKYCFFMQN